MFKRILLLGIVFSFAFVVSLFAQTIIKDDFRVNDDFSIGGSNQRMPAIAMDHQGNFVVVWFDSRNGSADIYGQRFDRSGNALGENFKVSSAPGVQKYLGSKLEVAMGADGDFVVVWDDSRNGFSDIYAQRYNSSGAPLGSNCRVNDDPGNDYQIDPAITMMPSGEFVVIWKDYRDLPHSIYGQRFASSGSRIEGNFEIVTMPFVQGQVKPSLISVAADPRGDFVTAWVAEVYNASKTRTIREIHAIRVNAENEVIGSEFKVNDSDSLASPVYPDIAADAAGNFIVAWLERRLGRTNVYAQRYDFKGKALGDNFQVNELSRVVGTGFPKVAMNLSKEFLITWIELRGELCVYLQAYNQHGEPVGGNFKVVDFGQTWGPSGIGIARAPSGNIVVTWDGYECQTDRNIFASIFDQKNEAIRDRIKVDSDSGSSLQSNPAIAASPSGKFAISWDDMRRCSQNIFAQAFTSNGEFSGPNFKVDHSDGIAAVGYRSSISMDTSGNSGIVFLSGMNVYLAEFDLEGKPVGDIRLVNEKSGLYYAYSPDIAMDQRGNGMVVWSQTPYSDPLIFAQLYDSQGAKIDSNFMVNSFVDSFSSSDYPKISWSAAGNIVVVWQKQDRSWNKTEVWGQLLDSSGERIGGNFEIGDSAMNMGNYTLDVGVDRDGNFVVAWSVGWNIHVQRFSADGSKVGSLIRAIEPNKTKTYNLSLAVKPNGEFMVVWDDYRNGIQDIYAQRFDSEGNHLGGNFRVNSDGGGYTQLSPVVAADDKNYYFAWVDNRHPGSGFDIFAKIISFEPTFVSEQGAAAKTEFILQQNYPNPFNPATTIPYQVVSAQRSANRNVHASIKIYNLLGQLVRTLVDEQKAPGDYRVIWDGKDEAGQEISSGIYFYVVKAGDLIQTRKMTLLR